jgi:hypothetical protein
VSSDCSFCSSTRRVFGLTPQATAAFAMMRLARSRMPPRYSAQWVPPTAGCVVVDCEKSARHLTPSSGRHDTDSRRAWISCSLMAALS